MRTISCGVCLEKLANEVYFMWCVKLSSEIFICVYLDKLPNEVYFVCVF